MPKPLLTPEQIRTLCRDDFKMRPVMEDYVGIEERANEHAAGMIEADARSFVRIYIDEYQFLLRTSVRHTLNPVEKN